MSLVIGSIVPISNANNCISDSKSEFKLEGPKVLVNTDHLPQTEANKKLKNFVEQIERLEDEKREISAHITDIYNMAKADGFDPKALRTVIRLRRKDKTERDDELSAVEVYLHALEG